MGPERGVGCCHKTTLWWVHYDSPNLNQMCYSDNSLSSTFDSNQGYHSEPTKQLSYDNIPHPFQDSQLENQINQNLENRHECLASSSHRSTRGSSSSDSTTTVRKSPFQEITNTLSIRQIEKNSPNSPPRHDTPTFPHH